jgi:hypothetical protein
MRISTFFALLLSAASAFASVPGQYLVFEIDRNDAITLVAAEEVMFAALPSSNDVTARRDADSFEIELVDAGGDTIYRTTRNVERAVRAEPGLIERESAAFVVRVPRGGESVRVRSARLPHAAQFSVRGVPSKFATLSRSSAMVTPQRRNRVFKATSRAWRMSSSPSSRIAPIAAT